MGYLQIGWTTYEPFQPLEAQQRIIVEELNVPTDGGEIAEVDDIGHRLIRTELKRSSNGEETTKTLE